MNQVIVEKRDRRESKGKVIVVSRTIYKIKNSDVYYVESESIDKMYYFVMFDTVKNFLWCECKDFENRKLKCKHLFAVEFAVNSNVVVETDKLPNEAKKAVNCVVEELSYKEDEYSF